MKGTLAGQSDLPNLLSYNMPSCPTQAANKQGHKSITPRLSLPLYPPFPPSELPTLLQKEQEETPSSLENDSSHRLFTFMDQKEAERKFIQEFLAKKKSEKGVETQVNFEKKNADEHNRAKSQKKRQAVINKLAQAGHEGIQQRSKSQKRERSSLSRLRSEERKLSTLQVKEIHSSKSKSPVTSRCSTPRLKQRQAAKNLNTMTQILLKPSPLVKKQVKAGKKHSYKSTIENNKLALNQTDRHQKELLRKKQQLERELSAINDSLSFCRKLQQRSGRASRA